MTAPEQQLLAMTKEMLALAETNEWDRLAELEQSRKPVFQAVFSAVTAANETLARDILAMDQKVMALAEAVKPVLQQQLAKLKISAAAKNAYQAVQELSPIEK